MTKPNKKEVYGMYCPNYDVTFVMEEYFTDEGVPISLEVKGFYYGEPNEYGNEKYYGVLKADLGAIFVTDKK